MSDKFAAEKNTVILTGENHLKALLQNDRWTVKTEETNKLNRNGIQNSKKSIVFPVQKRVMQSHLEFTVQLHSFYHGNGSWALKLPRLERGKW